MFSGARSEQVEGGEEAGSACLSKPAPVAGALWEAERARRECPRKAIGMRRGADGPSSPKREELPDEPPDDLAVVDDDLDRLM
jgi:hypothetical protein